MRGTAPCISTWAKPRCTTPPPNTISSPSTKSTGSTTKNVPPGRLHLREDLRTRMSYCLVYEVKSLSSEEKIQALANMAQARQLSIDPDIYRYLLEHWRQDLNSLLTMFNDLANYSITQGKPITLPLLRKLLKQQENA